MTPVSTAQTPAPGAGPPLLAAAALLAFGATALPAACVAVDGDRILARDLAAVRPEFSALPPERFIAHAPAPGARRTLSARELDRLANQNQIELSAAGDVCFEYPVAPLARDAVLAALRAALDESVRIELVDFSRFPVPRGKLEFSRSGLAVSVTTRADVPATWHGRLRYSPAQTLPVWARVKLSVLRTRVVAVDNLPAGHPIQAGQVRLETAAAFPFGAAAVEDLEHVVGWLPRRSVPAGSPVAGAWLAAPKQVERGDTVVVEVSSGAARLKFRARAASSGNAGEVVQLQNPENGRRFSARVEAPGKAVVNANPQENSQAGSGARAAPPRAGGS